LALARKKKVIVVISQVLDGKNCGRSCCTPRTCVRGINLARARASGHTTTVRLRHWLQNATRVLIPSWQQSSLRLLMQLCSSTHREAEAEEGRSQVSFGTRYMVEHQVVMNNPRHCAEVKSNRRFWSTS
jgi:hypothetical protein